MEQDGEISIEILRKAKEKLPREAGEVVHFADSQICFVNTDKNQILFFFQWFQNP